jgi:ABC-type transport system involved in multi-copper enzyme maturation permease subunit
MLHLLQLEWKKIASNRLFKVSAALYLLLMPLLYFTMRAMMNPSEVFEGERRGVAQDMIFRPFYTFPEVWETTTYWASWLTYFILTYLVVWMVTSEYSNRTMRQNIITGISRRSLFLSKFLMIVLLALGATLYVGIVTLVVGAWEGGYGYWFSKETLVLGQFFVQTLFYMTFALLLAIWTRRSGLTMLIFFAYLMIVERVVRYLVFHNILGSLKTGSYLPGNAASDALPLYVLDRMPDVVDGKMLDAYLPVDVAVYLTMGYIVLFSGLAYWVFSKRDL